MSSDSLDAVLFDLDSTLCRYGIELKTALVNSFGVSTVNELPFDISEFKQATDLLYDITNQPKNDGTGNLTLRQRVFVDLMENRDSYNYSQIQSVADRYTTLRENSLMLYEGVPELLDTLGAQAKLGLLTNGPGQIQWPKIDILDLEPYFDGIFVSGDYGISKPDPEIFEVALDSLSSRPEHSLYIGNSLQYDIQGAENANMCSIWVNTAQLERTPDDPNPDYTIDEVAQLLEEPFQTIFRDSRF